MNTFYKQISVGGFVAVVFFGFFFIHFFRMVFKHLFQCYENVFFGAVGNSTEVHKYVS